MAPQYKNPPIIEAVCEFRFDPSSDWDSTILGLIYKEIKKPFPIKEEGLGIEIGLSSDPAQRVPAVRRLSKMKFWSEDKRTLAQVGRGLLVVNVLKPYPSWDKYLSLITKCLNAYWDKGKPKKIVRTSLAYINQIPFKERPRKLEDYFNVRPHWEIGVGADYRGFIAGVRFGINGDKEELKIELIGGEKGHNSSGLLINLNLEYSTTGLEIGQKSTAIKWIKRAHKTIEITFEESLKPELKTTFNLTGA